MKSQEQNNRLTIEEIQETELQVLLRFRDICEKYNLRYSLAYGTLLGAIRHKGFIPWDDDIDVMMPRPDYMEFISVFDHECAGERFGLVSMHHNKDFFAPLAKMYDNTTLVVQEYGQIENTSYGVYIDIFIVDGLPEDGAKELYNSAEKLRYKWGMANRKLFNRKSRDLIRYCAGIVLSLVYKLRGYLYYRDKYDKLAASTSFDQAKNVAVIVYGEGLEKEMMVVDEFTELSRVAFEGYQFNAIKNPHLYLERMYGNYMVLPPEDKRISKHCSYAISITD